MDIVTSHPVVVVGNLIGRGRSIGAITQGRFRSKRVVVLDVVVKAVAERRDVLGVEHAPISRPHHDGRILNEAPCLYHIPFVDGGREGPGHPFIGGQPRHPGPDD